MIMYLQGLWHKNPTEQAQNGILLITLMHYRVRHEPSTVFIEHGVSVVTTTWNEKDNIQELIQRINAVLKDTPHEVIVVDDNSADGTLEAAKQYADVAVGKQTGRANQRLALRRKTGKVSRHSHH